MTAKWYVVRTEPKGEFQAARALNLDGMDIYLPLINSPRHRQRQGRLPLFPGYLFIKWDHEPGGWPTFRSVHRITGWVNIGDEVPFIPDEAMTELMERVDAINGRNGLWRKFLVGETVMVDSGAFQGLAEVVEEAKSPAARALVLMRFMGRMVQTQVPWVDLQPGPDQPPQIEKLRLPRRTRGKRRWVRGHGPEVPAAR